MTFSNARRHLPQRTQRQSISPRLISTPYSPVSQKPPSLRLPLGRVPSKARRLYHQGSSHPTRGCILTTDNNSATSTTELEVSTTAHPPAPAAEVQKATPATPEETVVEETPEQQEARKQSKFQRRLERQKTARIAAETEAKLLREERDGLRAKLESQGKQSQESAEPKREDFADYEAYLRAVAKHDAKQETAAALKAEREAQAGKDKKEQDTAGSEKVAKAWSEREASFQAATKDYETVVEPFVAEDLKTFSKEAGWRSWSPKSVQLSFITLPRIPTKPSALRICLRHARSQSLENLKPKSPCPRKRQRAHRLRQALPAVDGRPVKTPPRCLRRNTRPTGNRRARDGPGDLSEAPTPRGVGSPRGSLLWQTHLQLVRSSRRNRWRS
jgi:hypothetical protein